MVDVDVLLQCLPCDTEIVTLGTLEVADVAMKTKVVVEERLLVGGEVAARTLQHLQARRDQVVLAEQVS